MAEFSYWWTTNGSGSGDQVASYTQAHLATISKILSGSSLFNGVSPGYLNDLVTTVAGSNSITTNSGGAVVDGKPYENDSAAVTAVTSASGGGNTRIDRLVLRADWAGFTVSLVLIAGVDAASPSVPTITETSGTTFDILLYQVLIDTSGTITLTDERVFSNPVVDNSTLGYDAGVLEVADGGIDTLQLATDAVTAVKILNDAITTAKILNDAITEAKILNDAVTTDKILNDAVTNAKIGTGAVNTGQLQNGAVETAILDGDAVTEVKLADNAVSTDKVVDNAVTTDKIGGGVLALIGRQGGHATDWDVVGTTDYTPSNIRVQAGSGVSVGTITARLTQGITITFPTAFSATPVALAVQYELDINAKVDVTAITSTTMQVNVSNTHASTTINAVQFTWLAIGPE